MFSLAEMRDKCVQINGALQQANSLDLLEIHAMGMILGATGVPLISPIICSNLASSANAAEGAAHQHLRRIIAVVSWFSQCQPSTALLPAASADWSKYEQQTKDLSTDSEDLYARGQGNNWSGPTKEFWRQRMRALIESNRLGEGVGTSISSAINDAARLLQLMDQYIAGHLQNALGQCNLAADKPVSPSIFVGGIGKRSKEIEAALAKCADALERFRDSGSWKKAEQVLAQRFEQSARQAQQSLSVLPSSG